MSKVKLLTIHWGLSYGAVMQTYATCKILEKLGHQVSVINLIHPKMRKFYTQLRSYLLFITDVQFGLFKKKYFKNLTEKKYFIDRNAIIDADYIIVGSDQVWNRDLTGPIDLSFFVDFEENIPKISLASSFGKTNWTENQCYTEKVKMLLAQFKHLSVREDSGREILENVFNLKSTVLIDPTLAYGYYDDLILNNKQVQSIYTFFIQRRDVNQEITNYISEDLCLPIFRHSRISHYLKNTPRNWLTYIYNSKLVITDSFHGVVFSIIFKKQFVALCAEESKFSRIKNLLDILGLTDRVVYSIEDYENRKDKINRKIKYDEVESILTEEREKFYEYVRHSIN